MKNLSFLLILTVLILFSCQTKTKQEQTKPQKPNIIFILADDLGYGDISCQGQTKFQTPNIDRLASEGLTFTQHYAGSTVCSPSRSVLLTGQHTGHTPIRGNKRDGDKGNWPLSGDALDIRDQKVIQTSKVSICFTDIMIKHWHTIIILSS